MNYGQNINPRVLLYINSVFIFTLAIAMVVPAITDYYTGHPNYKIFAFSSICLLVTSGTLILTGKTLKKDFLNIREIFILAPLCWAMLSVCAAFPLYWGGVSFLDALFEVVSSLTTTGATVALKIDDYSKGIQIWLAVLQWLGGIGIIVMAMAVMPVLRIGGIHLMRLEYSDSSRKALPKVAQLAAAILTVYILFTSIGSLLLRHAGMDWFNAFCHSMGAISTGGFSPWKNSIEHYNSFYVEIIVLVLMLIGGTPLVLFIKVWKKNWKDVVRDHQVKLYYKIILYASIITSFWLWNARGFEIWKAIRHSFFTVVSLATSSGYHSTHYGAWGSFPILLLIFLSVMGGCSGSTAGGIKVFRLHVVWVIMKTKLYNMFSPRRIINIEYHEQALSEKLIAGVVTYLTLWGMTFIVLALLLTYCNVPLSLAVSASLSSLSNLGIAFVDDFTVVSNFSEFSSWAKGYMMLGMLLGRLEFVSFFVLIIPSFWRE